MSHIFDTLRRIEGERNGVDTRVLTDAVDLLELTERKFPPYSESTVKATSREASRPAPIQMQRLRVVGSPLSVGNKSLASVSVTVAEPAAPPEIPPAAPVQSAAPVDVAPEVENIAPVEDAAEIEAPAVAFAANSVPLSVAEPIAWRPPHPFEVRQQAAKAEVPGVEAPGPEAPLEVVATQEIPAKVPEKAEQKELNPAKPADEFQVKLPAGVVRTVSVIRTVMPIVRRALPLFERRGGNFATAVSNFLAPQAPATTTPELAAPGHSDPEPVQQIELSPIQNELADLKVLHHELGDQIFEQGESLKRIDYQLERMRESTDRNTLEQQELIEELKDVGKKVNFVVLIAVSLLDVSVFLETVIYMHIIRVLR